MESVKIRSDVTLSSLGAAASSHTHNYAGSSSAGGAATSANKVNTNLAIKLNGGTTEGTNLFTFNGSAAKTVDITPSAIGAAASSHGTHVTYSTTAPKANGTAAVGSESAVARGDHVHPLQTTITGNAGSATKVNNSLAIKLNGGTTEGTNLFTFNGSAAKTVNITPSAIGAAASSHTHSYLPLSGGALTGRLTTSNKISLPTTGGMWISGMDLNNPSIGITTQQTNESYHPVLGVKTYNGNYVNLGGINNNFGFYGYNASRTENGIDWQFSFDTVNRQINTDFDIRATANTGYFGALALSNNHSLYGTGTDGKVYNICGVDSSNHVYIGWGNETYVNHNNSSRFYAPIEASIDGIGRFYGSMYSNPDRFELVWYDDSLGDFNWNNKFYFTKTGQFYAGQQISINGHRITPYSTNGVSIIRPDGQEFSGLELKELWIGPYSGATYKFTVSPSAPSSPGYGTVWVQNN